LGLIAGLRIKRGILGSLIWSYIVCPEIFGQSAVTHAHASEDIEGPTDLVMSKDTEAQIMQTVNRGKDWAKDASKDLMQGQNLFGYQDQHFTDEEDGRSALSEKEILDRLK
jgi:hypothetical protein